MSGKLALTPPPVVRAPFPSRAKSPPRAASPAPSTSSPLSSLTTPSSSGPSTSAASKPKTGKTAPDLHRRAITACMRASPAGAKILHMGARLAVGIMSATRELERMCGDSAGGGERLFSFAEDEEEEEGLIEDDYDDDELDVDVDAEGVDDLMDEEEEVLAAFTTTTTTIPISAGMGMGRLIAAAPSPISFTATSSSFLPPNTTPDAEDVPMPDAPLTPPTTLSASWIVIGGEEKTQGDWEMV
ncbi:hypothetical protein C8F04DRAFT_1086295 [Mycena alexandri]|uniref:Uncharacterized protein n=1 Tax=Mycena alexandri TaxID=1745969 RepID=A0AAD6X5C6_9AGAR|nr:hypothetical protein C8F04DRAFT_1086295 [Mycena alexandri]